MFVRSSARFVIVGALALVASCSAASDGSPPVPTALTTVTAATSTPITATTTTTSTTTTTVPESGPPPLPDLSDGPIMLFGAIPPKPARVDYVIPAGASDYFELFEPEAPWAEAAERVQVFRLHAFQLRHYLTDDELRTILEWLDENQIPLLFETEPLPPPDPAECDHAESFEGPYDLEMARRIKDLGGTIAVVAIEQPFTYAHQLEGPRVCHYSLERIVDEVMDYMTEMREMFPGVPVGSIEGLLLNPLTTPDDMALWLDTWEELSGEPFAFLHIDVNWLRPDWPDVLRGIEAVAEERGVPFGVLYNGGSETTSAGWLQQTAEYIAMYEMSAGGDPDHISLQTWVDQPDHVLPEDDPGAFTSLINRYYGTRTTLDSVELIGAADETPRVIGRLIDEDGTGLAGQEVHVKVTALETGVGTASVSGVVPDGATVALIAARVNAEDAVPGNVNIQISDFTYTENGDGTNLVPNGDLSRGGESWGFYGEPFGTARVETVMSLAATPDEVIFLDGEQFSVTAGANFDLSATFAFDTNDTGIGVVSVIFLDADMRISMRVEAVPQQVSAVVTDADGNFVVELPDNSGQITVDVTAIGDLNTWPALLRLRR